MLFPLITEAEHKPRSLVSSINPQELYPSARNIGLDDIKDRENDLAGNLSLNQELDHIMTVNRWIQAYGDSHPPLNNCKIVEVRTIKMSRETAWGLRHTSKFDRSPEHYAKLRDEGQTARGTVADGLASARQGLSLPTPTTRDIRNRPDHPQSLV